MFFCEITFTFLTPLDLGVERIYNVIDTGHANSLKAEFNHLRVFSFEIRLSFLSF